MIENYYRYIITTFIALAIETDDLKLDQEIGGEMFKVAISGDMIKSVIGESNYKKLCQELLNKKG